YPAGAVRGEGVLPHPGAHLTLAGRRGERQVLGHRTVDRPVPVQVAGDDEHRTGVLGGGEQGRRDRRPVGGPAVVWRVGAVVERGGAAGEIPHACRVGRVGGDPLDARTLRSPAPTGDDPDLFARV